MTVKVDRSQEIRMLRRYSTDNLDKILKQAAKEGARSAKMVMSSQAPIGRSERPSQSYRKHGLGHGTFRKSVKQAAIRRGGKGVVGQVVGPMGPNAFTRHWIEKRTGWVGRVASEALKAAQRASEAVLEAYARG